MHGESILTVAKMLDVAIISPPCKENITQIMLTDKNQHNQLSITSGLGNELFHCSFSSVVYI